MRLFAHLFGDLRDSYEDFRRRERAQDHEDEMRLLYARLYNDLSILDTKGGALLQFLSLLVTAYTLIISPNIGRPIQTWFHSGSDAFLVVGAGTAYLAAASTLLVIWVRWASSDGDADERARIIFTVRKVRTAAYRFGWLLGFSSLTCLAVYLVLANIGSSASPAAAPS